MSKAYRLATSISATRHAARGGGQALTSYPQLRQAVLVVFTFIVMGRFLIPPWTSTEMVPPAPPSPPPTSPTL